MRQERYTVAQFLGKKGKKKIQKLDRAAKERNLSRNQLVEVLVDDFLSPVIHEQKLYGN